MSVITVKEVDFDNPQEVKDHLKVLNSYATDIMGGGEDLSEYVQVNLATALMGVEHKLILMAYDGDEPVGIANCFYGFSTFKAKPLLNIHDFAVVPEARGKGVGLKLLQETEKKALEKGCCKLTLEVLEGNERALKIYNEFGFAGYELDPKMGKAIFLDKVI